MEEIKNVILDFIFETFSGANVLFSALVTFDFHVIKRTCYELSFWQYLGIFFLFLLLLKFTKYVCKKISPLFVWVNSQRAQEDKSVTKYSFWQRRIYQRLQEAQYRLNKVQSKLLINFDIARMNNEQEARIYEAQVLCDAKKHILQSKECTIELKPPLNNQEAEIFKKLRIVAKENNMSIFPQIPLRAFIKMKKDDLAYYVVGGMYVDFLLVDLYSKKPLCVVEYWGEGHYGSSTLDKERTMCHDELKEAIFKEAGIRLVVLKSHNIEEKMAEFSQGML